MGIIMDKVITPYMIFVDRPFSYTRAIIKPQTSSFRLFLRNLEPFLAPYPINALVVYFITLSSDKGCNSLITITAILARIVDHS